MAMAKCKVCGNEFKKKRWNQKCCSKQCRGEASYKPNGLKETLCWYCKKTNGKECPWFSRKEEPVPGWKATQTELKMHKNGDKNGYKIETSYIVHSCPLFERERGGNDGN